jgi:hypothetical protein
MIKQFLWKIFGNDDDWPPPDWYMPGKSMWKRKFMWLLRNPLHNFTFYVIGIADKEFTTTGRFPNDVFNPAGGWNWFVCEYKGMGLPFISYMGKSIKFYIGWREKGNFGIKLTRR